MAEDGERKSPRAPRRSGPGGSGRRGRPQPSPPRRGGRASARGGGPEEDGRIWLFGIHAVRDALANPSRRLHRLIVTPNARQRLAETLGETLGPHRLEPEIADPRRFSAPLDPGSVHQGAALEAEPLDWPSLETLCAPEPGALAVALDRVTDPHNVGAILRSAEVFGARAVIAPRRHAAPETGALAKSASGALERQPYLRVPNLGNAIEEMQGLGWFVLGLDGDGDTTVEDAVQGADDRPILLVMGAEGPGLRTRTRTLCDRLVRIESQKGFASLNVSNAAAVALYATSRR
ncbi:MAG: RNA methyltransferase [Pseudomonadota bacterium]